MAGSAAAWRLDEVRDAGEVWLPDGRLGCGDPAWTFEGVPIEVRLDPGRYPVRVAVAAATADGRRACAAGELIVTPDAEYESAPERDSYDQLEDPALGGIVLFAVEPQHQECLTWAGRTAERRLARLVTDLGLLGLDPRARPLPWS